MAKKRKSKKKPKVERESEFSKEIRYLNTILELTLRARDGKSEELDSLFKNQADRIYDQIENLRKNNDLS